MQHSKTATHLLHHKLAPQYPSYQEPVQIATSKSGFYQEKHFSEKELKKKEIMDKFDDIPIKELNKAEAYQTPMMEEPFQDDDINVGGLSLIERIESEKWKARMKAYKEIGELFYVEYSKQCQQNENNPLERDEEDILSPFDQFGPFL